MVGMLLATTCVVFLALSGLHVYWAFAGRWGAGAAVPSTGGVAAFKPGRGPTLVVAALLACAALCVFVGYFGLADSIPRWLTKSPAVIVAIMLGARAIGDFKLVGFFKQPNDSRFARLDALLFSPLCLALAAAILVIVLAP